MAEPRAGDTGSDETEFEDLDTDEFIEHGLDDFTPTRSSLLEPGPLSLSGLIIGCASFVGNPPLDDAIDARLYAGETSTGQRIAEFAERAAVAHMVIAGVGLILCAIAVYLDDETDAAWARVAARAGIVVALVAIAVYLGAILLGDTASHPAITPA